MESDQQSQKSRTGTEILSLKNCFDDVNSWQQKDSKFSDLQVQ